MGNRQVSKLLLVAAALYPPLAAAEEPRNWFNDPFLVLSASVPNCPEPLGPRISERERLQQSHHRAEKGTSCWLQGLCTRPNAVEYDLPIAESIKAAWSQHAEFEPSSVWLTVQGRIVYFEGCSSNVHLAEALEKLGREVPFALQAIASIMAPQDKRPPYRTWAAADGAAR